MPHMRSRYAVSIIQKLASFWPIVGVVGLRQVGKTTLLRKQIGISKVLSFDDEDTRLQAEASSKVFLSQQLPPLIIDEVQKVPKIFDALKSKVDRQKRPGEYYLTGSSEFSTRLGIRESLTGRIGLLQLYPLTLGEFHQKPIQSIKPIHPSEPRFSVEEIASAMVRGGLPVPAFLRDSNALDMYWKTWLDTLVYRDLNRAYGKSYDPEIAFDILKRMAKIFLNGDLPAVQDLGVNPRKIRPYLEAMQTVFLVQRFRCHEEGVGKDLWLLGDSGLANYLMEQKVSPGASFTLARHFILNEILSQQEYIGKSLRKTYFKSAKGSIIDFVWDNVPIKIIESYSPSNGWQIRALEGAMKKLKSPLGLLVAPTDLVDLPKKGKGIGIIPWSYWS
jgi:predicted AAA+ superfamily ATPase